MKEETQIRIKKILEFEKNGETFSIEVHLENVSPERKKQDITDFLEVLYKDAIDELIF